MELQGLTMSMEMSHERVVPFLNRRFETLRDIIRQGKGGWFGAFEGDLLVGDGGLFWGDSLARFKNIETRESHRRRGICGTFVENVCHLVTERVGEVTYVFEADNEEYEAGRVYESLGFRKTELVGSFCRYDRSSWDR